MCRRVHWRNLITRDLTDHPDSVTDRIIVWRALSRSEMHFSWTLGPRQIRSQSSFWIPWMAVSRENWDVVNWSSVCASHCHRLGYRRVRDSSSYIPARLTSRREVEWYNAQSSLKISWTNTSVRERAVCRISKLPDGGVSLLIDFWLRSSVTLHSLSRYHSYAPYGWEQTHTSCRHAYSLYVFKILMRQTTSQ